MEVKTFQGPGPFTALRSAKAFAHGLAMGYNASLACPSFFDVFSPELAQVLAIHTGISQWIIQNGQAITQLTQTHMPVSSSTFSKEMTLDLAQRLAYYGQLS